MNQPNQKKVNTMVRNALLIIVLLAAFFCVYSLSRTGGSEDHTGKDFDYNFELKDLNGKRFSARDYKGKVLFLNIWATWCGPCRSEMPGIQKLYESTASDNIVFVMLSVDRKGDEVKVASYVKANKYSFPVLMPTGTLPEMLDVPTIPTTFIVGKDGKLVEHKVGSSNYNTDRYKKLLKDLAQ